MNKGERVHYRAGLRGASYPRALYEVVENEGDGYLIIIGVRDCGQDKGRKVRVSAWRMEAAS